MSGDALTVAEALSRAQGRDERIDLRMLLGHALERPLAWLLTHADAPLGAAAQAEFEALWTRRRAGEPVAYLIGEREFHGLTFSVEPAVLIPRPETELLVDALLALFAPGMPGCVADLGTGSGAIAVTLACRRPQLHVIATDRDPSALDVAQRNAIRLGAGQQIHFRLGDWCAALAGERFDAIVANPPYIAEHDPHLVTGDLRFEPRHALVGGADGLRDLSTIIAGAPRHLRPGGHLLLEHGHDQAEAVRARMTAAGFDEVCSSPDLAGIERITLGRWLIDQPDAPDYAQGLP
jgi:release factor glutamine methyltransferase